MSGILGQAAPPATTWTDLYTAPVGLVSASCRVIVSNRSASARSFRVAASKGGAALANEHYITGGNQPIAGDDTGATIAIVLSAGDIVRVYASTNELSFTLTGETRG